MHNALTRAGRALRVVVLIVLALLFLIPFYLLVRNGLATEADITAPGWTFFPHTLQWSNLTEVFQDPNLPWGGRCSTPP